MKILYLHGWQSVPGGVKPSYLKQAGHQMLEPALPDEDFDAAVRIAENWLAENGADLIVGSSRGGAVAVNMQAAGVPRVLLCPAWKRWGSIDRVPPGTIILHAPADEVVPYADSQELLSRSGLSESALIAVGTEHRLADPESLAMLLKVVDSLQVS
ncbi:YqiA/YcfP family alpha/beta fold hydrolase [Methyloterricola oryzae]|uniref:YqiA/YcfP family alpha/beta fold hydrolase n=1 Tax=Methyloterricola oryzae TaxID=1495050 RepID=UPI0005EB316B|nr:YqiA/YcfP family alpha/beta fold hydrolase [Methyloterricola oryzae]